MQAENTETALGMRRTEQALDALARGRAARLEDLCFRAAEWAEVLTGEITVALSGRRADYLGIAPVATAPAAALPELLYAPALTQRVASRPAAAQEITAVELVKRAGLLPAALFCAPEAEMPEISTAEATAYLALPVELKKDSTAFLPLSACEHTRVTVFRERGGMTHLALSLGTPEKSEAPLVRIHSSCLTGDLLGSLRCDCGGQLQGALAAMEEPGGVLLYLNQEGRGIGLANKLRAYGLQENGLDTVDANLALGFEEDERNFALAAQMLFALGIRRVQLLTNNPAKVKALQQAGVEVRKRVPLSLKPGEHNRNYLETKAKRLNHQY